MPSGSGEQHLRALAPSPRPTGGESIAAARAYCGSALRDLGFSVDDQRFEYSAWLGRYATPVAGLWMVAIVSVAAGFALHGHDVLSLATMIAGIAIPWPLGAWAQRDGVLGFPWLRTTGVNIEAVRSATTRPRVWLVAHLDSKWQPIPMVVRVGAILVLIPTFCVALVVAWAELAHPELFHFWAVLLVAAWLSGGLVASSVVGSHSPGAVDNASGVATVLRAAAALPSHANVGVLITDAEELALAGAYAWSRNRSTDNVCLNCDGVDDGGRLTVMYHGRQPDAAAHALLDAARAESGQARIMRMPVGMLTDSVAFTKAGMPAATLSRGSIRTLWRVHSTGDSLMHMKGTGIEATARVLAAAAQALA